MNDESNNKEIVDYEEYMRTAAYEAAATEKNAASLTFFSTKGGILTWGQDQIQDNKMPVIVLDFVIENTYYTENYNPSVLRSPICYAIGQYESTLRPHELAEDPQHTQCIGCPQYEWGSSTMGKGKACKSKRRLAVIPAATLDPKNPDGYDFDLSADHFEKSEIGGLRVPVTSCGNWGRYVTKVEATYHRPPFGMVTLIEVVADAKTQFQIKFRDLFPVKKELLPVIIERHKEARGLLDSPFAPNSPEETHQDPKSRKYHT